LLTALGFYSGPIDGIPDRTAAALGKRRKLWNKEDWEGVFGNASAIAGKKPQLPPMVEDNGMNGMAYALDTRNFGRCTSRNPCRIIALCPVAGDDEGVKAQFLLIARSKHSSTTLICCEYITLTGTVAALERVAGMIPALLIGGLPKFLWWKATPDPNNGIFKRLAAVCNSVIVDSCGFTEPETDSVRKTC